MAAKKMKLSKQNQKVIFWALFILVIAVLLAPLYTVTDTTPAYISSPHGWLVTINTHIKTYGLYYAIGVVVFLIAPKKGAAKNLNLNKSQKKFLTWFAVVFLAMTMFVPMITVTDASPALLTNSVDFFTPIKTHIAESWMFYLMVPAILGLKKL